MNFRSSAFLFNVLLALLTSESIAGVVTLDEATRCSIKNSDSDLCRRFQEHPWRGKYEITLGLDGSFSARTASDKKFAIGSPGSSELIYLENQGTVGIHLGLTARLEIFEALSLAFTAGFDSSFMSASPNTGIYSSDSQEDPFSISYSGPYVEGAVFYPVQRIDTVGVSLGFRKFFIDTIKYENKLESGPSGMKLRDDPSELFLRAFAGPFYMSLMTRNEKWSQIESPIAFMDNSGFGIEVGISGPILFIFPPD